MQNATYKVNLTDVFEGPMDLLIFLIKKNEVDIYDIPIALITEQYLAYLEVLQAMNIDLAGDFLLMASTLAQIKSKMLLPIHSDDEEMEDPRMELVRPLQEYMAIKSAAEFLESQKMLGSDVFARAFDEREIQADTEGVVLQIGLFELIDAFRKVLDQIGAEHQVDLAAERKTVKARMSELIELLEQRESLTFDELFTDSCTIADVIVTFLATLEMVRLALVRLVQIKQNGLIRIFYQ